LYLKTKIIMGRGDIRTKKGKIKAGSFGNARPKKALAKTAAPVATEAVAPKAKKAPAKKKEEAATEA
jgi:30S ribosomal protein S31